MKNFVRACGIALTSRGNKRPNRRKQMDEGENPGTRG